MRLSKALQGKLKTVLWITLSWTIISTLQLGYEIAVLKEYGYDYRWSETGGFMTYFLINTLAFVVNGLIGGVFIVFFVRRWIRSRSYAFGLLAGVAVYIVLFFLLTCLQNYFVISSIWDGTGSFFAAYVEGLADYFFSLEFVRYFPFWLLVLTGTLIVLFISDKYGPGILKKFLLGKYFQAKSEERIFMFLDLKGSTTIAEKLGESRYFNFIQQVFKDVTSVLLDTKAEVYQYVGDEIVLTWKVKQGIEDDNCIRCFQEIQKLLQEAAPEYQKQFGAIPEFKAGIHVGTAIVGEVGVIKRDIAYSGDVLNTTARIQSRCNEFGTTLLISGDLLDRFPEGHLSPVSIGQVELRGKAETVALYSL
ncbi:MAG: adenylate/guanylate cyclase domain-containing protein [Saprospiraceae bacterium]|nr:adenylate/guanylate cyclase domain-containing protein [Lewinella sp.]